LTLAISEEILEPGHCPAVVLARGYLR
jgi:hypothetical protein